MKPLVLLTILSFFNLPSQIRWENAKDWKIYKMPSHIGLRVSLDSLSIYKNQLLDIDRMRTFLKTLQKIKNINPVWTGLYVASCELDNTKRKILFSRYGGFLFDESSKSYYQIPENLRQNWLNFLNESSKSIDGN